MRLFLDIRASCWTRLLHSPSLVAVGLSMVYETWLPICWCWQLYRLGVPHLHWIMVNLCNASGTQLDQWEFYHYSKAMWQSLQQWLQLVMFRGLWNSLVGLTDPEGLDSFTVPLLSPNGRHLPAVGAVQRDCHWGLKNGGNSHWSHEPIMQWGTRQSQPIFRPTSHKRVMPANQRPCLIPHWQSYCRQSDQTRTV